MKNIKLITNGSYRDSEIEAIITSDFGCNITTLPTNTTTADIDAYILNGDTIIVSIFDLYNEIAYLDYAGRVMVANDISKPISKVTRSASILSNKELRNIEESWRELALLFLHYSKNDDVVCINGNSLLHPDSNGLIFEKTEWNQYMDSHWFSSIFSEMSLTVSLSTKLFGAFIKDSGKTSNEVFASILQSVDLDGIASDNVKDTITNVLICVQNVEDDIVEYIEDVIAKYPVNSKIYIFDIGSSDTTYELISEMKFAIQVDGIFLLQRYRNVMKTKLTGVDLDNISTRLASIYDIAIDNIHIHGKDYTAPKELPTYNTFKSLTDTSDAVDRQTIESFCTVATKEIVKELDILIQSVRNLYDIPIYVVCDAHTKEYLEGASYRNIICTLIDDDIDIDDLIPSRKADNNFHNKRAIYQKMETMRIALAECKNTMFLDADIVLIKPISINSDAEVILSSHHATAFRKDIQFGAFNAGYLFTSNIEVPDTWEYIYRNASKFYEQEGMHHFASKYNTDVFPSNHNIGIWRGREFEHIDDPVSYHIHTDPKMNNNNHPQCKYDTNIHLVTVVDRVSKVERNIANHISKMNHNFDDSDYDSDYDNIIVNDDPRTRIVICVHDIEEHVKSYIFDIIEKYGTESIYFIYDLASDDNTHDRIVRMNLPQSYVSYKRICRGDLLETLTSMKVVSDRFEATYQNLLFFGKNQIEDIEVDGNKYDTTTKYRKLIDVDSIGTIATRGYEEEACIMIKSVRLTYGDSMPIYIRSDAWSERFIKKQGFKNLHIKRIIKSEEPSTNVYYTPFDNGVLFNKMEVMRDAFNDHDNVLYLDSDIIVCDKVMVYEDAELMMGTHYRDSVDFFVGDIYGQYNAGHIYTNQKSLPDVWEELYSNVSLFGDQEILYALIQNYNTTNFELHYNVGLCVTPLEYSKRLESGVCTLHIHTHKLAENRGAAQHHLNMFTDIFYKYMYTYHIDLYQYIIRTFSRHEIEKRFGNNYDSKYDYILMTKMNVGMFSSSAEKRLGNLNRDITPEGSTVSIDNIKARLGDIPVYEYLEYKMKLFNAICHKTVTTQTDLDFTWVIYCDINTPSYWKSKFLKLEQDNNPKIKIYWTDEDFDIDNGVLFDSIVDEISDDSQLLVTSILDIDDGLSPNFIEEMKSNIVFPSNFFNKYVLSPESRYGLIVDDYHNYKGWVLNLEREVDMYQYIMMVEVINRSAPLYGTFTAFHRSHEFLSPEIRDEFVSLEYPHVLQTVNNYSIYNGNIDGAVHDIDYCNLFDIDNIE